MSDLQLKTTSGKERPATPNIPRYNSKLKVIPSKEAPEKQELSLSSELQIEIPHRKPKRSIRSARTKRTRRSLERSTSGTHLKGQILLDGDDWADNFKKGGSASRIRLPFMTTKKKSIDADCFIPIAKKKDRMRKRSVDRLKGEGSSSPLLSPLRHGSAAHLKSIKPASPPPPLRRHTYVHNREDYFTNGTFNPRMSINLVPDAAALFSRLSMRPGLEKVQSYIKEPTLPIPYTISTWTSPIRIDDDWLPIEVLGEYDTPLISRECCKQGYNIEVPRRLDVPEEITLMDADKDVKFFSKLCENGAELIHFIGEEENLGVVIISIENDRNKKFQRAIIRTPNGDQRLLVRTCSSPNKTLKILFEQCPSISTTKLFRVRKDDIADVTQELIDLEEKMLEQSYKFGLLYAAKGQITEDDFFNNVEASPDMIEFISGISEKITLKDWPHFRGGLDVRSETTGEHSYYAKHRGCEIMFHVSTLIPFYPKDTQQVERKRHLGNDIVVIVFKEGDEPFDPLCIHSQFNRSFPPDINTYVHKTKQNSDIFVVIQPVRMANKTFYRVEWCAKPGVPPFKPYDITPGIYESGSEFKDIFLTKLLNAQRAAMYAKTFRNKMSRTRRMLYSEIMKTYSKQK